MQILAYASAFDLKAGDAVEITRCPECDRARARLDDDFARRLAHLDPVNNDDGGNVVTVDTQLARHLHETEAHERFLVLRNGDLHLCRVVALTFAAHDVRTSEYAKRVSTAEREQRARGADLRVIGTDIDVDGLKHRKEQRHCEQQNEHRADCNDRRT